MSKLCQTSKRHVHSKQLSTKWVTDIFQAGWCAVCRNGTLKSQTDYLFMCWSGGCFCPSCHTSISNVKGPNLGCVKAHHVQAEKKLSWIRDGTFRKLKFSVSFSCKLSGIASWIWTKMKKRKRFLFLSSTWDCWKEKNKKKRNKSMCGERRWEVMSDGGRVRARKKKDSQHCFICLGVGWCKQTQSLCKLLILWTVKSSLWKQEN